jgi:hypothetical protein
MKGQSHSPKDYARLNRKAVYEFGAPVFVPGGKWWDRWRFGGKGRSNGTLTNISVGAQRGYESSVYVTTYASNRGAAEGLHDQGLVAMVLGQSVPHDVRFPFTSTVEEVSLAISLEDGRKVSFRALKAPRNWIALGQIDERWIQIQAIGVGLHETFKLERISDLDRIPENRFGV